MLLLGAASAVAVAWKRVFLSSALTKIRHPHSFSPQSDNFARGLGVTVTDSCLFNQRTQFATMSVVMFQSAVSVGLTARVFELLHNMASHFRRGPFRAHDSQGAIINIKRVYVF